MILSNIINELIVYETSRVLGFAGG